MGQPNASFFNLKNLEVPVLGRRCRYFVTLFDGAVVRRDGAVSNARLGVILSTARRPNQLGSNAPSEQAKLH